MIKHSGVVHAVANCQTCGWTAQGYKNAQSIGAKHARTYGHKVMVDVGLAIDYDATMDIPTKKARRKK